MKRPIGAIAGTGVDDCQHGVDTKAFKGRGALRDVRDVAADVDKVRAEMEALVVLSMREPGLPLRLSVHFRSSSDQWSLRWRSMGVAGKHVSWQEAKAIAGAMPIAAAKWYADMTDRALLLNQSEMALRAQLRAARRRAGLDNRGLPTFPMYLPPKASK